MMKGNNVPAGWQCARLFLVVMLAALAGCGGSSTTAPPAAPGPGAPGGGLHSPLRPHQALSREDYFALKRNFSNVISPQARAALAQLGMPAASPNVAGDKSVSVTLPYSFSAAQEYSAGGAGWIARSGDVVDGPF